MTQEKIDKVFETPLGQQCLCLYTTSDDRVFIRRFEAEDHADGRHTNTPLRDKNITEWYPSEHIDCTEGFEI